MASNRISVLIDVTVDKANKALGNFRRAIGDADGAVGKFKAGTKLASDSVKANIVPMAATAGLAFVGFAAKAIGSASDLQESTNAVNKSFGATADGVLKIGENAAESMGLSRSQFNEAAVAFSTFAEAVAGPGGDVAGVIGDLTTRASDFASVMNISVAEAATVFRSGLSGETEPLKRFGLDLSAAAVEAYALSTGLAASKDEMTEGIKVQARYGLLMSKTAKFAGDFADTSDGLANKTRIAQAKMEDFQAEVGENLIPVVETAMDVVMTLADAMESLGTKGQLAGEKVGDDGVWDELKENVEGVLNPVGQLGRLWNTVDDAFSGSSDSAGDLTSSMSDVEINAGRLAKAAEDAAEAEQAHREQIEKNIEALEEITDAQDAARQAIDDMRTATLETIDSSFAYRKQVDETAGAIAEANDVMATAERGTDDYRDAAFEAEGAALDQAAAALRLADDQATANGEALTAQERTNIYRDELLKLRDTLQGDARIAIQMHIDDLNKIPKSIATDVVTTFRSVGTPGNSAGSAMSRNVGRASGGPVDAGGAYLVGENGPELLQMGSRAGHVVNNQDTKNIVGSSGMSSTEMRQAVAEGMVAGWKRVQQMTRAT